MTLISVSAFQYQQKKTGIFIHSNEYESIRETLLDVLFFISSKISGFFSTLFPMQKKVAFIP